MITWTSSENFSAINLGIPRLVIVENFVGTEDKRENKELLQFFNGIYHERDVCADDNEQKQQGNENDDVEKE